MRKLFPALVLSCMAGQYVLNSQACASLMVYEGFDYNAGLSLNQRSGGTGFAASSTWSSSGYVISGTSLDNGAFDDSLLTGGSATYTTTATASRYLDSSNYMNMDSEGSVYYLSFLVTKTSTSASNNESAYLWLREGGTDKRRFGLTYSETTSPDVGISVGGNTVYYFVAKIVTHSSTNDEVYVSVFTDNAPPTSEPVTWQSATTELLTGTINRIKIENHANTGATFDEIRIGTQYADVVAVPEPAALGVMTGCGMLLLSRLRRK